MTPTIYRIAPRLQALYDNKKCYQLKKGMEKDP
jgi:hypothetical protein